MTTYVHSLGEVLKKNRLSRELFQKEFAQELGGDEMSYNAWENDTRLPDIHFAAKIRSALGTDTRYLKPNYSEFKEECLSAREASEKLSINYHTLQAWVGKYKLIEPKKSTNGRRIIFSLADLEKLNELHSRRVIGVYGERGRVAVQKNGGMCR